jgi:hypothetical protein
MEQPPMPPPMRYVRQINLQGSSMAKISAEQVKELMAFWDLFDPDSLQPRPKKRAREEK